MTKEDIKEHKVARYKDIQHIKDTVQNSLAYLKNARKQKGWSIAQLARESGVSVGVISDLENDKGKVPSLVNFIALTRALDMPEEYVLDAVLETREFKLVNNEFVYGDDKINPNDTLINALKAYGIHDIESIDFMLNTAMFVKSRTKNKNIK